MFEHDKEHLNYAEDQRVLWVLKEKLHILF